MASSPNLSVKTGRIDKSINKKQGVSGIFSAILILFFLLLLLGIGLGLSIYLKLIDLQQIGKQYKLQDYPVIGSYFKPEANQELENSAPPVVENLPGTTDLNKTAVQQAQPAPVNPPTQYQVLPADLETEKAKKENDAAKQISKLARLYGEMKPEEAVNILNKLDDETVLKILSKMEDSQVAKILTTFDPKRSANLTQAIMSAKTKN